MPRSSWAVVLRRGELAFANDDFGTKRALLPAHRKRDAIHTPSASGSKGLRGWVRGRQPRPAPLRQSGPPSVEGVAVADVAERTDTRLASAHDLAASVAVSMRRR